MKRYIPNFFAGAIFALSPGLATTQTLPESFTKPPIEREADFSDLVLVGGNTYLVVSDYKMPIHPGNRLSLMTISGGRTVQIPISIPDWKHSEGAPSDLEACCAIPGRENEFLLAESGAYLGKFGRIFHIALGESDELIPNATVKGVVKIYDRKLDEKQRAWSGDQVEGMACIALDGKIILITGERGGASAGGSKTGTVVWGELNLADYSYTKLGEAPLLNKPLLGGRDCGSLQLLPEADGSYGIVAVATNDPGEDGPFESIVYRAGKFTTEKGTVRFDMLPEPKIMARLSGLKVEGLAKPAAIAPASTFMISTDDEAFGAVLRPLRISTNQ